MINYLFSTYYSDDDPLLLSVFHFGFPTFSNEYINAPDAATRDNTYAAIIASILKIYLPARLVIPAVVCRGSVLFKNSLYASGY